MTRTCAAPGCTTHLSRFNTDDLCAACVRRMPPRALPITVFLPPEYMANRPIPLTKSEQKREERRRHRLRDRMGMLAE